MVNVNHSVYNNKSPNGNLYDESTLAAALSADVAEEEVALRPLPHHITAVYAYGWTLLGRSALVKLAIGVHLRRYGVLLSASKVGVIQTQNVALRVSLHFFDPFEPRHFILGGPSPVSFFTL